MARILIIGNDEDRSQITPLLTAARHEWRGSDVMSAPSMLRTWRPDAVVIDVPATNFDGGALVGQLREAEGNASRTPIMVLIPEISFDDGIAILRAGADQFLGKPVDPREFTARMKALLVRYDLLTMAREQANIPDHEPGRILAFYGAKGGVGTTTVAINTAIALRRVTKGTVCLVDANFQWGDMRVFMDFNLDKASSSDVAQSGVDPEELLHSLVHHDTEIDVLLAPPSPEAADLISADHVTSILGQLQSRYDYVVVDLERRVDDRALRVFDAADVLFLVMNGDLPSLKTMRLALEMLDNLGVARDRVRLLLNRAGAFTGIKIDDIKTVLGRPIDFSVANDYRSAVNALNSGTPTMVAAPDSLLGCEFTALVEALVGPTKPTKPLAKAFAKRR